MSEELETDNAELLRSLHMSQEEFNKLVEIGVCPDCLGTFSHDFDEPFAHCDHATSEWPFKDITQEPLLMQIQYRRRFPQTLEQYAAAVNALGDANTDKINEEHRQGERLFGASYTHMSPRALKCPYDEGIPPAGAMDFFLC